MNLSLLLFLPSLSYPQRHTRQPQSQHHEQDAYVSRQTAVLTQDSTALPRYRLLPPPLASRLSNLGKPRIPPPPSRPHSYPSSLRPAHRSTTSKLFAVLAVGHPAACFSCVCCGQSSSAPPYHPQHTSPRSTAPTLSCRPFLRSKLSPKTTSLCAIGCGSARPLMMAFADILFCRQLLRIFYFAVTGQTRLHRAQHTAEE